MTKSIWLKEYILAARMMYDWKAYATANMVAREYLLASIGQ